MFIVLAFNHSGREEIVSIACCTLVVKFFTMPSCDTSGFFEQALMDTGNICSPGYSFDNFESLFESLDYLDLFSVVQGRKL